MPAATRDTEPVRPIRRVSREKRARLGRRRNKHASHTHKHSSAHKSGESGSKSSHSGASAAQPSVTVTANFQNGVKLAATTDNAAKASASPHSTTQAKQAAQTAVVGPVPFNQRTTLIVPLDFSFTPAPTSDVSTQSPPTSTDLPQSIPTTPALLSLPILSIPTTNLLPSLRSSDTLLSSQSSVTFPTSSAADSASFLAPSTTISSSTHGASSTSHPTSASHDSSPPIALIAGLVATCVVLFVFGPCLICKFLKFRRKRALVSFDDFSPGIGGSKSFGSPVWGPTLEKMDSFDEEKNIASLFPNPPRPTKQKLHPDIRMHIGKPHPVVLPDFVSAGYGDDIEDQDYLKNNRIYERGEPINSQNHTGAPRADPYQQPQVKVTGPTPSTSAASTVAKDQPQQAERRTPQKKIEHDDRTFSYVNFEDHIPPVSTSALLSVSLLTTKRNVNRMHPKGHPQPRKAKRSPVSRNQLLRHLPYYK